MRGSRLLALISVVAVTACTTATGPPDRRETTASARLGTLPPSYPIGEQLSPGIEVTDWIPAEELTTTGSAGLDENDPCAGIPPEVVTPARVDPTTAWSNGHVCFWHGELATSISSSPGQSHGQGG